MVLKYLLMYMLLVIFATVIVLPFISQIVLYRKKGKPGWGVIVPIYSEVLKFKIAGLSPWLILLYLVPIADIVIGIIANIKFIKAYGKSTKFAVGALFFPEIFYPIAAFPDEIKTVNKKVYSVFTLLFGCIGVNKLYAGKVKSFILRLVFCWTFIPLILSLTEFVAVLTEKADSNGKIPANSKRRDNVLFGTSLVLFVLFVIGSIIPWESLINKLSIFSDFNKTLGDVKIGSYSLFSNVIGAPLVENAQTGSSAGIIKAFGSFVMADVSILLFVLTLIIAFVSKLKVSEAIGTVTSKMKKVLPVAITAMLISIVLVTMVTTGINTTIVNWILSWTKGFNIITTTLSTIVGSTLASDYYYFLSTLGSVFKGVVSSDYLGVTAFIMQSIHYLTMIIAPTSVGLIIGLYYLDIPYTKWFKYIWKVLLSLLILVIIIALIIYALI